MCEPLTESVTKIRRRALETIIIAPISTETLHTGTTVDSNWISSQARRSVYARGSRVQFSPFRERLPLVTIAVRYGRAIHAYVDVINCPTANAMRTCVRRSVTVLLLDVHRGSFPSVPVNLTIADDLKQYPRPRNERNNIPRWLDEWAAIVFSALIVFSGSQYQRFWFDNHIYVMNSQLHSVVSNWYSDWACRDNIPVQVIDCLSNVILVVFIQRRFTSHLAPWEMMWEYISRVEW